MAVIAVLICILDFAVCPVEIIILIVFFLKYYLCLCQQVKIERQQKEINELESLCGFLEQKLVTGSD